jgi:hypothetical protein
MVGYRQVRPGNPELEALMDECMDLRVQISLLMDAKERDDFRLSVMLKELNALEKRISTERPARA